MSTLDPNEDYYRIHQLLNSMGFIDVEMNRRALKLTNGNHLMAVEYLTNPDKLDQDEAASLARPSQQNRPATRPPADKPTFLFPRLPREQEEFIQRIHELGFKDEGKIRHALMLANYKVEEAVDLLLADDGLRSDFSSLITSDVYYSTQSTTANQSTSYQSTQSGNQLGGLSSGYHQSGQIGSNAFGNNPPSYTAISTSQYGVNFYGSTQNNSTYSTYGHSTHGQSTNSYGSHVNPYSTNNQKPPENPFIEDPFQ